MAAIVLLLTPHLALAQSADSTLSSATTADAAVQAAEAIETIVITSTKREALARDLPISVSAVTGQQLEENGASELRDVLSQIPGVQQTPFQPELFRISIRGIQSDIGANTPESTGLYIDDVPFNDPFLNIVRPDLAIFDLDAIEIMKGPQGTLFGGSGLAGGVRYRLTGAKLGVFELHSFGQYQSVDDGAPNRTGGVAVNLPVTQDAALRLVAVRRLQGGVINDLRNDEKNTDSSDTSSYRALLNWQINDRLSVEAKALRQDTDADDIPFAETTNGRLERSRALLPGSPTHSRFKLYGMDLHYRAPWGEVVSSTSALNKYGYLADAYGERLFGAEADGNPIGFPQTSDVHGRVQEIRVLSPTDPAANWQWLVGVFGNDYDNHTTQNVYVESAANGERSTLLDLVADISATEYALFGEATRRLGERWRATLGARLYSVETEGTVLTTGPAAANGRNINDADIRSRGINPRFALQYQAADNIGTYASAARGFRFGGIQINGPSEQNPDIPQTYSPDSVWNYELGMRSDWLNRRLQADATLFYVDWHKPQIQTVTDGDIPLTILGNVGGARSYGAETALHYRPLGQGLQMSLAAAYTNARTTEDFAAPGGAIVKDGTRLPGYADVQASGSIAYEWQWAGADCRAWVTHTYQGSGESDIVATRRKIYDYQTTDLRASITGRELRGQPRLSLGVFNVADERALVSVFAISDTNFTSTYNRPRTFDLRLDLSF